MSHVRQQVREAVATLLNNGTHTKWTRAYETRIPSTREQNWNYLMVFAVSDLSQKLLIHPTNIYERDTTISVIGMLRLPGSGDTQTIEDKMDAMAVDIETRLTSSAMQAIVANIDTFALESSAMDVIVTDDGPDHAELTMVWRVTYTNNEGSPETLT